MYLPEYVLAISSRGRFERLLQTLNAFNQQTRPPALIVLVNNNDDEDQLKFETTIKSWLQQVVTLPKPVFHTI